MTYLTNTGLQDTGDNNYVKKKKKNLTHSHPRRHPSDRRPPPFGSDTERNTTPEPQRGLMHTAGTLQGCVGGIISATPHNHVYAHKENTHRRVWHRKTGFDGLIVPAEQLRVVVRH